MNLQINTSELAYKKFLAEKTDSEHYREILNTLIKYPYLSNWGISSNSSLTYHQVARRTGELRNKGLIKEVGRVKDADGSLRIQYALS